MGDSSISRIYQFLSNYSKTSDWKKDADRNGDGIIIKAEAYSFLNNNFEWQDGDDKNDIIYKFWKSIDTETTGKVKSGSKINNQNALSDSEMQKFERNVAISEQVDKFMEKIGVPTNKIKDIKGWRDAVKSSMLEKAFEYLAKNPNVSGISNEQLQQFYELSMRPATVKYVADATITEKLGKIKGYASSDDKTLDAIINEYMKTLDGDSSTSIDTLISKIEEIVSAYADTAVNNNQTDKLKEYGYDPEGPLNDLQKAVLGNSITETITQYLSANAGELVNSEDYKDTVNSCVKSYVESYLSGKKASEFVSLKNFDINQFDSSEDYKNLIQAITDAETAKNAEKYKAAFGTIGTGMQQEIDENWRSYTSGTKSTLHTEFGVDANGNIVFEQSETTSAYNSLKQKLKTKLSQLYPEAFSAIQDNFDKILQAAWITTYNSKPSSTSNRTDDFIKEVLNNLKNIMNKLSTNPEYLTIFTAHTAYANSNLTSSLEYYGNNKTYDNDPIWVYRGNCTVNSDGGIEWDSYEDSREYDRTMHDLLNNILNSSTYNKDLDKNFVTNIFRQAQQDAINACRNNIEDCPYGTTSKVDGTYENLSFFTKLGLLHLAPPVADIKNRTASALNLYDDPNAYTSIAATGERDWAGTSREGDRNQITVQSLVELTLYYFDKLLYQALAS